MNIIFDILIASWIVSGLAILAYRQMAELTAATLVAGLLPAIEILLSDVIEDEDETPESRSAAARLLRAAYSFKILKGLANLTEPSARREANIPTSGQLVEESKHSSKLNTALGLLSIMVMAFSPSHRVDGIRSLFNLTRSLVAISKESKRRNDRSIEVELPPVTDTDFYLKLVTAVFSNSPKSLRAVRQ